MQPSHVGLTSRLVACPVTKDDWSFHGSLVLGGTGQRPSLEGVLTSRASTNYRLLLQMVSAHTQHSATPVYGR